MREKTGRVVLDGSMARGGGGFTYLVNVAHRLAVHLPGHRFRLYLRSERLADSIAAGPEPGGRAAPGDRPGRPAALHLPGGAAPGRPLGSGPLLQRRGVRARRSPCPTIASFRNPNVFAPSTRTGRCGTACACARCALSRSVSAIACDRILFVSEDSARWIGDRGRLARAQARGRPPRRSTVGVEAPSGAAVHPRPYILSVSSVYRYKNFVRLIEAYAALAAPAAGRPPGPRDHRRRPGSRVLAAMEARARRDGLPRRAHPHPRRGSLRGGAAWYAGAELFVFPSYLETFGHPLLEAMASEVPVVAADIPVFREIAGDAAFYADPHRPEALARAMEEALFVPGRTRDAGQAEPRASPRADVGPDSPAAHPPVRLGRGALRGRAARGAATCPGARRDLAR